MFHAKRGNHTERSIKALQLDGGMLRDWCDQYYSGPEVPDHRGDFVDLFAMYSKVREEFYSSTSFNVVTPENFWEFANVHKRWMELHDKKITWDLQEQWSGSSRLSRRAHGHLCVGFPVDLRYGWDLRLKRHRDMIDYADKLFETKLKVSDPDSYMWTSSPPRVTVEPCQVKQSSEHLNYRRLERPARAWLLKQ